MDAEKNNQKTRFNINIPEEDEDVVDFLNKIGNKKSRVIAIALHEFIEKYKLDETDNPGEIIKFILKNPDTYQFVSNLPGGVSIPQKPANRSFVPSGQTNTKPKVKKEPSEKDVSSPTKEEESTDLSFEDEEKVELSTENMALAKKTMALFNLS